VKFDRLRLLGFKSFVDATELKIDPGLTGVVGPNGCGKSNLLEALRWVMGETSAKKMRGAGMEDVIFGGTAGRPSRNNAEVTLIIDNAERSAPSDFNGTDELEIVRRIERDAGSAYKINGKDVRARDVQLLFADASTGSRSPALVRQGQIGELIGAKPKARRAILEEAAGISGLHSRRHEAELRLRAAETNLTRLEDVVQQIEMQLQSLKRQARQATRYRNLSGHIRKAEATVLHIRWIGARRASEDAHARLKECENAVHELTEFSAQASTAQADAAEKLPPLREAEAAAAAGLHRLTIERENLDREERRAQEEAENLQARFNQIEGDMAREKTIGDDADETLSKLKEEEASLRQANASQEDLSAAAKLKAEETAAELANHEDELDGLTAEAARLAAQRTSLGRTLEEAQAREQKLAKRIEEIQNEVEALKPGPEAEAAITRAQDALLEATAHVERAKIRSAETEADRARAHNSEATAREPLLDADKLVNQLRTEAQTLARVLQVEETGLWPPMIDAIKVDPGYEKALGAALGEDLDLPADTAAPVHWDTLPALSDALPLPGNAKPLSNYVTGPEALTRRLSHIGVIDGISAKSLQSGLSAGQRLVSLEGGLWRWDGLTAAAEAPTAAATRLAQRNRLADLDREIEDADARATVARDAFHAARQRTEETSAAERDARTALRQAQDDEARVREEFASIERDAERSNSRRNALADSLPEANQDLTDTRERKSEADLSLTRLSEGPDFQNRIQDMREKVTALRLSLSEDRAAFESLERERRMRTERLGTIDRDARNWQQRQENAAAQINTLETRAAKISTELVEVQKIPTLIEEKRKGLLDKISESEGKRNEAADFLAEAEEHLRLCDSNERKTTASLGSAREERARGEAQLEGANDRQKDVLERIQEALDAVPEDLADLAELKDGDDLPTLEKAEHKLDRLKRERENLGGVNLRADEEAAELQEKMDTMTAEREDLEGAIHRLRTGISSLNREGRERLLTAFETVNTNFQNLFKTLFVGGEAELKMVESEDPLEAGLEIIAKPPGKKAQVMSLLSGGEQALTAIALIFAVFQANPAPICVLDEVDAPLDDANVERFCNMLDEMTKSTQTRFLVITHHALTMSRMDRLYGVTMMERGVSHLVSVNLSDAERIQAAE
jgi:chromosome segregation protein